MLQNHFSADNVIVTTSTVFKGKGTELAKKITDIRLSKVHKNDFFT